MKIAFIVSRFPCLSETFILGQITGLLDRGHEVDIFAYSGMTDSKTHADVKKYKLLERTRYLSTHAAAPSRPGRVLKRLRLLIANFHKNPTAILKSLNPLTFGRAAILLQVFNRIFPFLDKGPYDIVHCHFGLNGELGLLLKDVGIFRGKIITTFYGYDISFYTKQRGNDVYSDLFKRGDLFLSVSEEMREKLINLGCDERKAMVLRLGIDPREFEILSGPPKNNGRVTILTVARLVEKKGVEYGIQALAKALKKHPHLEYNIVGDGSLKGKLQELVENLGVSGNVRFAGWKSSEEVAALLRKSDILLAPSVTSEKGNEEGTPVAIMEAFAHGVPVVSTYHAGIPEIVKDGESGFLVPERDVDRLADRLERLIHSPQLRSAMGQRGRAFVEEHYDIDKLNDRLVKFYEKLLDRELPSIAASQVSSKLSAVSRVRSVE